MSWIPCESKKSSKMTARLGGHLPEGLGLGGDRHDDRVEEEVTFGPCCVFPFWPPKWRILHVSPFFPPKFPSRLTARAPPSPPKGGGVHSRTWYPLTPLRVPPLYGAQHELLKNQSCSDSDTARWMWHAVRRPKGMQSRQSSCAREREREREGAQRVRVCPTRYVGGAAPTEKLCARTKVRQLDGVALNGSAAGRTRHSQAIDVANCDGV